ncbi:MAG: cytochrome c3 family protein [Anaerolineales bacterium]|nr:cytochrome c3 family protein [Anaerolineales bacterium]
MRKTKPTNQQGAALAVVVAVAVLLALAATGGGFWYYHEQPRFCSDMCHLMDSYYESWSEPGLLANYHSGAGVECLDCHEATIQDQVNELVANVRGNHDDPLGKRKQPKDFCLSCHEHDRYPGLAEATSDWEFNPHDSHYGEMECYNCHNMHRPSVLYCTQCHSVEEPEGWIRY